MTEDEWLASTDPLPMLQHLGERASLRKLRLYACAWGYSVWDRLTDERSRQAILTAERFADGQARRRAAGLARDLASPELEPWMARRIGVGENAATMLTLANYLRDLFGIPSSVVTVEPAWLAWQGGTVRRLAEVIY